MIMILFIIFATLLIARTISGYDNKYNDIEVLKVGYHRSRISSNRFFIDEFNPNYSIIRDWKNNRYGYPNKRNIKKIK